MITENGIIFLGTGSSSSIPKLSHAFKNILNTNNNEIKIEEYEKNLSSEDFECVDKFVEDISSKGLESIDELNNLYLKKKYPHVKDIRCYTCYDAMSNNSKNKRNNISILLKSNDSYVLIDVGKTFRDSILRNKDKINFYKINLHSVLISHSHTDALNGIDDLRDLQEFNKVQYDDVYYYTPKKIFDVYVNDVSYDRLRRGYDYLVHKRTENIFYSKIAALNIHVIKDEKYNKILSEKTTLDDIIESDGCEIKKENCIKNVEEEIYNKNNKACQTNQSNYDDGKYIDNCINIHTYKKKDEYGFIYTQFDNDKNIRFIPFHHGKNYICIGYIIGNTNKLVYISDCSKLPNYILEYIKKMGSIDILIIDALFYKRKHYSHFSLYESINIALQIKPKQVFFIGMSCDIEHNITNLFLEKLSAKYSDITFSLAHDGLFLPFNF
ncbi:hypothetical protein CYL21_4514 [Plasmodium falciparum NF54]|uniref:Hydrolase, putative n=3 Tax=Plasmodium falciparum TaxID=5833 RepID=Q8I549_PLAF7|nr:hydrolase, putative [Plasmodium falciparum 3D7]KAF4327048.1 hypothetical protein CYL21_4514 [Plasmodium falciparum NF54]PKC48425.1 hypothetical protein CK202_1848 [Plasmodium falciparum NF54]CZT99533.1 hydrolase, putative [Plasmodium falciparum 3D7]|eukprot:XP_001350768.1 conserved Plasmodium protein, unknown function [Plasmodium falciparum 3D7]